MLATSGTQNRPYFQTLAALLEPLAIKPALTGTFTHAITSVEYMVASYMTQLGGAGTLENRFPINPIPLKGVTLTGSYAGAIAVLIDPSVPAYANAEETYYARRTALESLTTQHLEITAGSQLQSFLPGPYGSIITGISSVNLTWVAAMIATGIGFNLMEEIGNAVADTSNNGHGLTLPVSKSVVAVLQSGAAAGGALVSTGGISFVNLPSTWGAVVDATGYTFRDDFTGASIDTATEWTRAQSAAGNVEIDTNFSWLKMTGNGNWGANGLYSQTSIARGAGKVFMADVHIPPGTVAATPPNAFVGWSDGAGQSYSNFAHGVDFAANAGPVLGIQIFELGVSRGYVGTGYTAGSTYRVRITLGAGDAAYAIQGLPEYGAIGGAAWTDITPGVTNNNTTPLYPGATINANAKTVYVGDVKAY